MKNKSPAPASPSESDIRDYAYHLFEQGDRAPGHELAHWFEASDFLNANWAASRNGTHHNPPIHAPAPLDPSAAMPEERSVVF
jgi:hypothetical protein